MNSLTVAEMVAAFNEWMRQYTEDPDAFKHSLKSAMEFLKEVEAGKEPSYGQRCAAFMMVCHKQLTGESKK